MERDRLTRELGGVLGVGFMAFGVVESTVALVGRDNIVLFWFPALCGGGVFVLLGVFRIVRPAWASIGLVTIGGMAGALATAWTLVLPVLVLALIVLVAGRNSPRGYRRHLSWESRPYTLVPAALLPPLDEEDVVRGEPRAVLHLLGRRATFVVRVLGAAVAFAFLAREIGARNSAPMTPPPPARTRP